MDLRILRSGEQAVFALRSLYRQYGYTHYQMSKFEEYEYYIRNKDFLISDRIIAFNDTNGKLLALKPDVTLSIIKNLPDCPDSRCKVCYDENIYRVSESTGQYKELMQAGLECIGDVDLYDLYETVSLAAMSLNLLSERFILQISHLGILSAVLDAVSMDARFRQEAIACISRKNVHDLARLCGEFGVGERETALISSLVTIYGQRDLVLSRLEALCGGIAAEALAELKALSGLLDRQPWGGRVIFDFSVVNNMSYYSGIVFTGFLSGISECVLSGGQYDKLMRKLNRKSGAVGFAVYLDLLEQLSAGNPGFDVDVLLLYEAETPIACVTQAVDRLVREGKTVRAQRTAPEQLRYREIIRLDREGSIC